MDFDGSDDTLLPSLTTTTDNNFDAEIDSDFELEISSNHGENNDDQYLSEVWFSDIDENPADLLDEIVLNEDIHKDIMTSNKELDTESKNHPTAPSGQCQICDKCKVTQLHYAANQKEYEESFNKVSTVEKVVFSPQPTQQHQSKKQQKQKTEPCIQSVEPKNNEHVSLTFKRSFKGTNAEHEIIYRVKIPKRIIIK